MKQSVWESVAVSDSEVRELTDALLANGFAGCPFTSDEAARLFAYRRMIRRGLFNEGVKP